MTDLALPTILRAARELPHDTVPTLRDPLGRADPETRARVGAALLRAGADPEAVAEATGGWTVGDLVVYQVSHSDSLYGLPDDAAATVTADDLRDLDAYVERLVADCEAEPDHLAEVGGVTHEGFVMAVYVDAGEVVTATATAERTETAPAPDCVDGGSEGHTWMGLDNARSTGGTGLAWGVICARCGVVAGHTSSGAQRNPGEPEETVTYSRADDDGAESPGYRTYAEIVAERVWRALDAGGVEALRRVVDDLDDPDSVDVVPGDVVDLSAWHADWAALDIDAETREKWGETLGLPPVDEDEIEGMAVDDLVAYCDDSTSALALACGRELRRRAEETDVSVPLGDGSTLVMCRVDDGDVTVDLDDKDLRAAILDAPDVAAAAMGACCHVEENADIYDGPHVREGHEVEVRVTAVSIWPDGRASAAEDGVTLRPCRTDDSLFPLDADEDEDEDEDEVTR